MADTKKVVVFNRGNRVYHLKPLVQNAGKPEEVKIPRSLEPQKSIEVLDEQEAAYLLAQRDIVDVAKMAPVGAGADELRRENEALRKKVAALEAQLAEGSEESEEGKKKKGR